jgi:hypothetical protein
MLSAAQRLRLEEIVRGMEADLHLEAATLDAHQTLELVLCRDFVCFRPLRLTAHEVDIAAALEGQAYAQQVLQEHLRSAIQGLL